MYLAGKLKDDMIKIRDVINVTHNTLNRGKNTSFDHIVHILLDVIIRFALIL